MDEDTQTRRVTIRLTPFQARRLWKLRSADLPEGARPRTVTEVLVRALLDAARAIERDDATIHRDNGNGRHDGDGHHDDVAAVHDELPPGDHVDSDEAVVESEEAALHH